MSESKPKDKVTSKVDNIGRRTWDLSKYQAEADDPYGYNETKAADAEENSAVVIREPLQRRKYEVDLRSMLNQHTVITNNTSLANRGGYFCDVCDCLLKDSTTYLDHINGKKHQRKLGMSMRVERSTLSSVRKRLASHKRKDGDEKVGVEERLTRFEDEMRRRKKSKKELERIEADERAGEESEDEEVDVQDRGDQDKDEGKEQGNEEGLDATELDEAEEEETEEEKMARMMGFGGFTASKKKT